MYPVGVDSMWTIHIVEYSGYYWLQSSEEEVKQDTKSVQSFLSMFAKPPKNSKSSSNSNKKRDSIEKERPSPTNPQMLAVQQLLADILSKCPLLQQDRFWHFFYEPEVIIRVSSVNTRKQVEDYLSSASVHFVVYDYPTPSQAKIMRTITIQTKPKQTPPTDSSFKGSSSDTKPVTAEREFRCYGEDRDGIVIRNLSLFLPIFHGHSVAALTLDSSDHFLYMERTIHTMFNPRAYTRAAEGQHLASMAVWKLGSKGVQEFMDTGAFYDALEPAKVNPPLAKLSPPPASPTASSPNTSSNQTAVMLASVPTSKLMLFSFLLPAIAYVTLIWLFLPRS